MKLLKFIPILFIVAGLFSGCAGNDSESIIGIWRVKSSKVEGREIGDGLGWFEFKSDGAVNTRPRPGKYDSGTYKLNAEKGTLTLTSKDGSMTYQYKLSGESLKLDAEMPNEMKLVLDCVKVDDYPITKDKDAEDDALMQTPVIKP